MKPYPIQLEISGPIALWTRPDTGSSPVHYHAELGLLLNQRPLEDFLQ